MSRTGRALARVARSSGREAYERARFAVRALQTDRRRRTQTVDDVKRLRARYAAPVFGTVHVWDLVDRLGRCVDPTDCQLLGASQQLHVLQVLDRMEQDGVTDDDLLLAAILHDVGKLALETGDDPANVVGPSSPIGAHADGIGLRHVTLQYGHAELMYERLVGQVPDHVAWIVRYHDLAMQECGALMDAGDRRLTARYLEPFQRYDRGSKSSVRLPGASIERYRPLVEKHLPDPIVF
jgi:hypothetical protein